jgi:hypothetical protein
VLVYADGRCVGWYAGGIGVVVVERWSNGSRGSECYVSASMGRRLYVLCCIGVLYWIGRVVVLLEWRVLLKSRCWVLVSVVVVGDSRVAVLTVQYNRLNGLAIL